MADEPVIPSYIPKQPTPSPTQEVGSDQNINKKDFRIAKCTRHIWQGLTIGFAVTAGISLIATLTISSTLAPLVLGVSGVGLTVLLVGAGFNKLRPHLPGLAQKIANHLYANVTEVFALLGVFLLTPAAFVDLDPKGNVEANGTPILLVHGYLHNKSGWLYIRHRLKKAGIGPVYTINLGSPFNSIEEYSKRVELKAKEIAKQTGRKDLILVGHSMGGIVSSYYATHNAPKQTVTDVITMGSPLKGTKSASLGVGCKCAKQMKYDCEFLSELKGKVEKCTQTRFFNFGSETDRIVFPQHSALFSQTNAKQVVIPDMGHLRYIFSDEVADQLVDYLKGVRASHQIGEV